MELKSRWIKFYAGFLFVFALGAGVVAYISPETMYSMLQINFDEISVITNGFAARNIAIAVLALFTLLSKNAYVYLSLFITRLAVDMQDLINGLMAGPELMDPMTAIISLTVLFIAPLILGIIQIRKEIKSSIMHHEKYVYSLCLFRFNNKLWHK